MSLCSIGSCSLMQNQPIRPFKVKEALLDLHEMQNTVNIVLSATVVYILKAKWPKSISNTSHN